MACRWNTDIAADTMQGVTLLSRHARDLTIHSLFAELEPIIDVIASFRGGHPRSNPDVSVTLPATEGQTLVVSVRSGNPLVQPAHKSSTRGLGPRQLRLVNETIDQKLAEPISISMLSSLAGLSRSHFSHAFRKSVGRPPHEHLVRVRIERAMKLMLDTDLPLCEVALATGFSDQAHFSNKFRRTAGMTPTRWRRAHQS